MVIASAFLLVAGMVLFVRLDASLKTGGVPRLAPPDAAWVLSTPDLPGFWRGMGGHFVGRAFRENYPQGEAALALRTRLLMGIRPTPLRWNLWMGRPAVLSGRGDTWCLVTRPGVAARVAILAGGMVEDAGRFRGMHCQWRDGLLVLSNDAEWATELRETPAPPPEIETECAGASSGYLTFSGGWARLSVLLCDSYNDLVLDGAMHLSDRSDMSDPSDKPETSATVPLLEFPGRPALTFCASDAEAFRETASLAQRALETLLADSPLRGVVAAVGARWGASLPGLAAKTPPEEAGVPFAAMALYGLHSDGAAPLPEAAGVWRGLFPSYDSLQRSLMDPARRIREWEGTEGLLLPLLGDALSLCLMPADGGATLAAGNGGLMARLAASPPAWRGAAPGECWLRVEGPALAALLRETCAHAAEEGWLPDTTPRELERTVLPLLRVLEDTGRLELTANRTADGLSWQGGLAPVRGDDPPEQTP